MGKGKYHEWLTEEGLTKIEGWARDGLSDKQIAYNIGISTETYYKWKREHSSFSEALKKGKEVVDREVENALFKSALGFDFEEESVANTGEVVKTRKYAKPNIAAQIFWLKNRKPDVWRDKQEVEQTNKNIEIKVGDWTEDETED